MSKGAYDIFALETIFLEVNQQPKHIAIGLFEGSNASRHALTKDLIKLLNKYDLRKKIIIYVKDEGSNLNTMTTGLKFVVSCDILGLIESFEGSCCGHAFSKVYQYVSTNEKISKGLKYVFVKIAQFDL